MPADIRREHLARKSGHRFKKTKSSVASIRPVGPSCRFAPGATQPHEAEAALAGGRVARCEVSQRGVQGGAASAEGVRYSSRWGVQLEILRWLLRCRGLHLSTASRRISAPDHRPKASASLVPFCLEAWASMQPCGKQKNPCTNCQLAACQIASGLYNVCCELDW